MEIKNKGKKNNNAFHNSINCVMNKKVDLVLRNSQDINKSTGDFKMSDNKTNCKYLNKSMGGKGLNFLQVSNKVSVKKYLAICDPNIENPEIKISLLKFPLEQKYISKYCENKTNFVNCYRMGLIAEETKKNSVAKNYERDLLK